MKLSDGIFKNFFDNFKKRGFQDLSIIKHWNDIELPKNIKNIDIIPFKIKNNTLYLRTYNKELFSEFNFLKNDIEEIILLKFGNKYFDKIKLLLARD